jgi:amino acid permease
VASAIGGDKHNDYTHYLNNIVFRALVNIPIAVVVLLPLSLLRNLSSLSFASVLSLLALTYTGIVMYIELPFYHKIYSKEEGVTSYPIKIDWNVFTACAMTFFAYTCQLQLLPIYSELKRPNFRRIKKVVTGSLMIDFIFYTAIASAGYWSTLSASPTVIITRMPLPNFTPDYAMLVAACALCLVIFAAFPCNFNPFRTQFFTLILR